MNREKRARILRCLGGLALVYVIVGFLVFVNQRGMLYVTNVMNGPPPSPESIGLKGVEQVHFETSDDLELNAWYAPPKKKGLPVVVVFHGNAGHIAYRAGIADTMMKAGYGVMLVEYRGYGGNPGSPTEEGLYKDARGAIKWLGEKKGLKPSQLVYYGESLGTGVTVQMATEKPPALVVLHSPYSTIADVARPHFWFLPVNMLITEKFESVNKIANVKAPLLVVHGARDTLIPIALAQKLFDAANKPKDFITFPEGGHNDLYQLGAGPKITAWMDKQLKKH